MLAVVQDPIMGQVYGKSKDRPDIELK